MNDHSQSAKCFQWFGRLSPRSVGFRVAFAVNLLVVVCGLGFMILAYQQESRQRLADKSLSLREQAMTLHQAVSGLNRKSIKVQQQFINAVCSRLSNDESPGHHIVVEIDGRAMQSQACNRESEAQLLAIRAAGKSFASASKPTDLLVGKHTESGITVYIAEQMESVRTEIRRQTILRSIGVAAFGLLLAIAVDLVIHKLVNKPLRRLVRTIDRIAAGNYLKTAGKFQGGEFGQVAAAVDSMSLSLARAEAYRQASLDRARRVQENLLPHNSGGNGLDVAFFHRAAEDVAGDYVDIFLTNRGTTILCVADVVGHGIGPAMIAAMLKVLLLDAAEIHDDPSDMVALINRRLTAINLPEAFATMFLAEWRPVTRSLHYINAGHEPALLISKTLPPSLLGTTGPIVGLDSAMVWESLVISIGDGDLLASWTDGITESRNTREELLGRDRLLGAIHSRGPRTPQEMLDVIDQTLLEHAAGRSPSDDCTALAICFV